MDVQLQELVDKIKKDGVETAEAKAAEIVKEAENKAAAIVKAARSEAETIIKNGLSEAERSEKAAVSAISQAGRNVLISFRDAVIAELNALVLSETTQAFNSAVLSELVPSAVKAWITANNTDDIAVFLSPSDVKKLESTFIGALKAEIAKGLEVKSDSSLLNGFRIGTKDGASYYDFSAQAVADLFSAYLNPRVAEILKSAAKEL